MEIKVVGSGLDAILFAYNLTKSNVDFEWHTDETRLGGYFRGGSDCKNQPIDVGMVLLEPNDFGVDQQDIHEFKGESGQSARPFIKAAYSWLENHGDSSKIVDMFSEDIHGVQHPDYFISDNLDVFSNGGQELGLQLRDRLEWLVKNPDWHPQRKLDSDGILSRQDVVTVYQKLYGKLFYETFFEGYLENLLGDLARELPANNHRKAWLPLFWPETILSSINQKDKNLIYKPVFKRFESRSIAQWIESMLEEIQSNKKVIKDGALSKTLQDENFWRNRKVYAFVGDYLFNQRDNFSKSTPPPKTARIRIVHFCCENNADKVVFLIDDESGCFRYSMSSFDGVKGGNVSIEFGESTANLLEDQILDLAKQLCARRGIFVKCEGKIQQGRMPISTTPEASMTLAPTYLEHKELIHTRNSMSFNDNIIRAYWAIDHAKRDW